MRRQLLTAIGMVIVMTLVCGLAYGLALTGIGEAGLRPPGQRVLRPAERQGRRLVAHRPGLHRRQGQPDPQVLPEPAVGRRDLVGHRQHHRVSGASNLGPSNPLLIGFVPGVNSVGLDGQPSKTNPFATPADPFCVPVDTTSAAAPVVAPTPGQKYAKNSDGTYVCDPNTVPERAIAYRSEFGLAAERPGSGGRGDRLGVGPRPRHLRSPTPTSRPRPWPGPATCRWPRCSGLIAAEHHGA